MNLNEAQNMAVSLMKEHLSDEWKFDWNKRKRVYGICFYKKKVISLSKFLTEIENENHVRDTILHEIAHAIAGSEAGHGYRWKTAAMKLGLNNPKSAATTSNPDKKAAGYKYAVMFENRIVKGYHRRPSVCVERGISSWWVRGRPETKGKLQLVKC